MSLTWMWGAKHPLYETIGIETRLLVESLGEAVFETNTLETSLKVFYDKKC